MLSKEFVMLVIISSLIAIPLAWYFLHEWLQKYEYRTDISLWIFFIAGLGALLITLLTVSFQAIKAAIANPLKSLRSEKMRIKKLKDSDYLLVYYNITVMYSQDF
jgi:ABC-type antimicrobial peptide transport system permease subunit